jgi:hypothetical protein
VRAIALQGMKTLGSVGAGKFLRDCDLPLGNRYRSDYQPLEVKRAIRRALYFISSKMVGGLSIGP